jgi:histidinol-phosphate aminotransferase
MEPRDLSSLAAYSPGADREAAIRAAGHDPADVLSLDLNQNPFGPSPAAVTAVREHAGTVHTYPKAVHGELRNAVADRWGVDDEQVWLTHSGTGALDYLARAFLDPGQRVLHSRPGFGYTATSARYHGGGADTYELSKGGDFAQTPETVLDACDGHRIVYVTTPHNPTGSEMAPDDLRAVADRTDEGTLLVVDEAYGEFTDAPSAVGLVDERDDVAVVRTFSKAYGLAGLRVGYAVTPAAWADACARVNTPFAVSTLACRAGLAALGDDEHLERTVETARWAREYLRAELNARTWPSGGNFVLADVGDATAVTEACRERGVVVRDCSSHGLPGCVRISCGTRDGTRRAVETLNDTLRGVDR